MPIEPINACKRGIILDMDGVLFDSEPVHARSWEAALAPYGIELPTGWFHVWTGIVDTHMAAHFQETLHGAATAEHLLSLKRAQYAAMSGTEIALFSGVAAALEACSQQGIPLAVATSSTRADAVRLLDKLGVTPLLAALVTCDNVMHKKPHPEPYLLAAQQINCNPKNCIVIEDTHIGIESALAAGCAVIAVETSLPADKLQDAHWLMKTTQEAIQFAATWARSDHVTN